MWGKQGWDLGRHSGYHSQCPWPSMPLTIIHTALTPHDSTASLDFSSQNIESGRWRKRLPCRGPRCETAGSLEVTVTTSSGKRQELDLLVRQTGPWGSPREVALLPHYLNVLKKGMPWPSLHFWKSNLTPGWRSHGASYYEKTRSGKILNRPYFREEDQITSKYSEKNLAA